MGVTLGRKVIKGGSGVDHIVGVYNVGESLANKVKSFVGLAGGNYGLTQCYKASIVACNNIDGFNPGDLPSSGPAKYLNDLNINGGL
jgi:triacylglycerol lipase